MLKYLELKNKRGNKMKTKEYTRKYDKGNLIDFLIDTEPRKTTKKYLEFQGNDKRKVIKETVHNSNSYVTLSTDIDKDGYLLVEIKAINNMQGNIAEGVRLVHIDDFNEFYK